MGFNATKALPPTRVTGGTDTHDPAADVNTLAAAIAEIQAAGLALTSDIGVATGVATYPDLPTAQAAGNAGQIAVGTLVVIPA